MKNTAFIVLCLAAAGSVANARRSRSAAEVARKNLNLDEASESGSPVTKVVKLLQNLKKKLVADGKAEDTAYDKFACWCEKTGGRVATEISTAETDLRDHGQSLLQSRGEVASLSNQIADTVSNIQAAEATKTEATTIRSRQNGEYVLSVEEMKQVLSALQRAITVLRENTENSTSLLQEGTSAANAIRAVIEVLPTSANLQPQQTAMLSEFTQLNEGAQYAPQSATVQGILADMYLEFASSLERAMETEARRNRDYETLMDTQGTRIRALNTDKSNLETQKASEETQLAGTAQIYDNIDGERRADTNVYGGTKGICREKHDDYVERVALRREEIAGVTKALEILTTDAARTLFSTTLRRLQEPGASASFLQVTSVEQPLEDAARAVGSLRLAALAVKLREKNGQQASRFSEVMGEIDTMIATLRAEGRADIQKRDQCRREYVTTNSTQEDLEWKLEKAAARLDKIDRRIADLRAEETRTDTEITANARELAGMTRVRRQENSDFLQSVQENEAAIALLQQAQDAVTSYYNNNSIAIGPIQGSVNGVLMQESAEEANSTAGNGTAANLSVAADTAANTTLPPLTTLPPMPDLHLSDKGSHKLESKSIISTISTIIADLQTSVSTEKRTEAMAHLAFERQANNTGELGIELAATRVNLRSQIASLQREKDTLTVDQGTYQTDLADERTYEASIRPDCDFIITSFTNRSDARAIEMQGLMTAKDYLAGFKPTSLLESHAAPFDDEALGELSFSSLSS